MSDKLVTPVFRASFCNPNLFEKTSYDGGTPTFGTAAIWEPAKFSDNDKKKWAAIKKAMDDVSVATFKKKVDDLPGNFKKGLRDGAEKDLDGYGEGKIFANLSTRKRPGVIDRNKNPIGPEHGNDDEIYPGCYCRATVRPYSYDNKGKGIALGLMNIQKVADGERLDSRTNAEEDFEDDIDDDDLENLEVAGEDSDDL